MGVDPSQADAVSSTSSPPPRTPTLPRQQGRADRPGRDRLFLTLIGGGVFANDMGWIYDAIRVRGLRPPRGRAGGGPVQASVTCRLEVIPVRHSLNCSC